VSWLNNDEFLLLVRVVLHRYNWAAIGPRGCISMRSRPKSLGG
jgi:hypothetical protein